MQLPNLWILEWSMHNNELCAITLQEQIKANRTCALDGIQHDYIPIGYFYSKDALEFEAEFIRPRLKGNPIFTDLEGRMRIK